MQGHAYWCNRNVNANSLAPSITLSSIHYVLSIDVMSSQNFQGQRSPKPLFSSQIKSETTEQKHKLNKCKWKHFQTTHVNNNTTKQTKISSSSQSNERQILIFLNKKVQQNEINSAPQWKKRFHSTHKTYAAWEVWFLSCRVSLLEEKHWWGWQWWLTSRHQEEASSVSSVGSSLLAPL